MKTNQLLLLAVGAGVIYWLWRKNNVATGNVGFPAPMPYPPRVVLPAYPPGVGVPQAPYLFPIPYPSDTSFIPTPYSGPGLIPV